MKSLTEIKRDFEADDDTFVAAKQHLDDIIKARMELATELLVDIGHYYDVTSKVRQSCSCHHCDSGMQDCGYDMNLLAVPKGARMPDRLQSWSSEVEFWCKGQLLTKDETSAVVYAENEMDLIEKILAKEGVTC